MPKAILGISAYYHDSAAVLLVDGKIVAAAHEERFSRIKHDSGFPRNAAAYVLREGGLKIADLDAVAFYDKPTSSLNACLKLTTALPLPVCAVFFRPYPCGSKKNCSCAACCAMP